MSAKIEAFSYLFDDNENAAVQAGTAGLDAQKKELKNLDKRMKEVEKRIDTVEKELEGLNQQVLDLTKNLEKTRSQQAEDGKDMARQQKSVERYLSKRGRLLEQKDKCNKSIRDLGVLPEEAFEKYTNTKSDKVSRSSRLRREFVSTACVELDDLTSTLLFFVLFLISSSNYFTR